MVMVITFHDIEDTFAHVVRYDVLIEKKNRSFYKPVFCNNSLFSCIKELKKCIDYTIYSFINSK